MVLKSGWKTEGEVTETEDQVIVKLQSGLSIKYPREDVVRIIRKDTPQEIFATKFKAVDRSSLAALEELASWCRLNGLGAEAVQVANAMLKIDKDNSFAKEILIRFKTTVEHIPPNKEREKSLLAEFGTGFHVYRSRHYRVCHNTDLEYAKERARYFEVLYEQFYRHFDTVGMPMKFLEDRVEVILFRSRQQYALYAGSRFPTLARTAGVYLMTDNRAVFFDAKGDAYYKGFQKQYSQYQRMLRNLRNSLAGMGKNTRIALTFGDGRRETYDRNGLRRKIAQLQKEAHDSWDKFQKERQAANLTTTMHECAHQLAFNLGIHPREYPVPKWLAEGVATFFEETEPERKTKTTGLNARQLGVFRSVGTGGLRDLITNDEIWAHFDKATEAAYARAWALFLYLSHQRQTALVQYLERMKKDTDKEDTAERRVQDFERAFGPLKAVQQRWQTYMTQVRAE